MFVTRKTYDAVVRERDEALALVAKVRANSQRLIEDFERTHDRRMAELREQDRRLNNQARTIGEMQAEFRHAYIRDARGRIARHPLNTGGKVKA